MKCNYCNNEFDKIFNNQVYCSTHCRERNTKIKKSLRQKKAHGTLKKRKCKQCGIWFRFHDMKKNCKTCIPLLKEKNYNNRKGRK